jgi:hypothetical protein
MADLVEHDVRRGVPSEGAVEGGDNERRVRGPQGPARGSFTVNGVRSVDLCETLKKTRDL